MENITTFLRWKTLVNDSVRKTVSFTEELELAIAKRAVRYGRSFSAQVAYDMSIIIERAKHPRIVVSNDSSKNDLIIEDKASRKWELPDDKE